MDQATLRYKYRESGVLNCPKFLSRQLLGPSRATPPKLKPHQETLVNCFIASLCVEVRRNRSINQLIAVRMGSVDNETSPLEERLDPGVVLIAGGGPVGLLLATVLAHYDVRSVLLERNFETTKWPKMDLTNARSMELFRRLGLADELRKIGVPAHIDQPVLFSSGLAADKPLSKWHLPSPAKWRKQIHECSDGTQPLEPWQRLSQVVLERWLKGLCEANSLIDVRFGWRVESVEEKADEVVALVRNISTGEMTTMHSDYMAGCDGASSRTRKSLELPLDGGPM